jgi:hypothetical protein
VEERCFLRNSRRFKSTGLMCTSLNSICSLGDIECSCTGTGFLKRCGVFLCGTAGFRWGCRGVTGVAESCRRIVLLLVCALGVFSGLVLFSNVFCSLLCFSMIDSACVCQQTAGQGVQSTFSLMYFWGLFFAFISESVTLVFTSCETVGLANVGPEGDSCSCG